MQPGFEQASESVTGECALTINGHPLPLRQGPDDASSSQFKPIHLSSSNCSRTLYLKEKPSDPECWVTHVAGMASES
jgi:hypothetical protein